MSEQKAPSPLLCKSCGARIDVASNAEIVECPYCGTKYSAAELLNESDAVITQRIKAQTAKEIEAQRMQYAADKEVQEEEKTAIAKFKKGKFSKFLIFCTIVSGLVTALELSDGFSVSGLIALIQAVLYLTTWLMGMGVIKEKKKNIRTLVAVIAFALIIPFFMFLGSSNDSSGKTKAEKFAWTDIEMHEAIPEPENLYGEIGHNSKSSLILTLCKITETDFKTYRDACIEAGYTIDADESYLSYSAYNADGYSINLVYSESSAELNIYLDAPEEMEEFEWPSYGIGSMLPATTSHIGKIIWDDSESFSVHVGNTTIEEYREYVKACEEEGFTVDYRKGDTYYYAQNAAGYDLSLRYAGFYTIEVSIEIPEDTESVTPTEEANTAEETESMETTEATDITEAAENNDGLINGMRPEFKEAMDSYEEFFDEYCAFMKKYKASNGTDVSLLLDYAKYMGKYTELMDAFAAWEEEEMNAVETAYYIQVQTRINGKLLEVAQ